MKIEVEVRVKITGRGNDTRVVEYGQQETVEPGDNPRFVQYEARRSIDHIEERVLAALAVQYPPKPNQ